MWLRTSETDNKQESLGWFKLGQGGQGARLGFEVSIVGGGYQKRKSSTGPYRIQRMMLTGLLTGSESPLTIIQVISPNIYRTSQRLGP